VPDEPVTTTTIKPEGPVTVRRGSGPLLSEPSGLELWFQGNSNDSALPSAIYRLDLDTGDLDRVTGWRHNGTTGAGSVATETGLIVLANNSIDLVGRDGRVNPSLNGTGDPQRNIVAFDADGFWSFTETGQPQGTVVEREEFTKPGESPRIPIVWTLPSNVWFNRVIDERRFSASAFNGQSFVVDIVDGSIEPVDGGLLAMAPNGTKVTFRCDDRMVCGAVVISADGREFPAEVPIQPFGGQGITLSPDGDWVVVPTYPDDYFSTGPQSTSLRLPLEALNPQTGERLKLGMVSTDVNSFPGAALVTWSPDGRWMIARGESSFIAWPVGGTPLVIPFDDMRIDTLALGPRAR
jgi:hypothetical protein